MKKNKILFLFLFTQFYFSCEKIFPDDKLTLKKEPFNGKEIQTSGYFYFDGLNTKGIVSFFFFRNGVVKCFDGTFSELTNEENLKDYLRKKDDSIKYNWGIFNINKNVIQIERWVIPSFGGPNLVYLFEGEIKNDSTFIIKKSKRSIESNFKNITPIVYHYQAFSPKPDSTNIFIK
jgi:hypothetical protein